MVTAALADLLESALLTALTVTVSGSTARFGALYRPLALTVPRVALPPWTLFTNQVTAVLVVFATVAVNCLLALRATLALVGEILTLTADGGGGGGAGLTTVMDALPVAGGDTTWVQARGDALPR